MRFAPRVLVCAGAAMLLASCASLQPLPPEEAVAKRAQARYDALIARDFKKVHGYFTPAYRERFAYEDWIRSRPPMVRFRAARVLKVECVTEETCDVEVESAYDSPRGVRSAPKGTIDRVTPERWIRVDGQWWIFQAR